MSQTFRKYVNNRGSALFMVLSTMSALFLLVTAMYFSVISSKQVQYAVFNQEQAYQSSISVSDALVAALRSGKATELSNAILALKAPVSGQTTGGVLSTNGNGFSEFLGEGTGSYSQDQLGAYDIEVTRLCDATENGETCQVYDIAITTCVGGVLETTHTFVRVTGESTSKPNIFSNGMTSTGYVPNSPRLDEGVYETPIRIDSEYCVINDDAPLVGGRPSYTRLYSDLTCTGTLRIVGNKPAEGRSSTAKPMTWVIGNDLIIGAGDSMSFIPDMCGTASEHGQVIVGGSVIFDDQTRSNSRHLTVPSYTDMYVLGDLYVKYGIEVQSNANLYVAGNIYFNDFSVIRYGENNEQVINTTVDPSFYPYKYGNDILLNGNIYVGGNFMVTDKFYVFTSGQRSDSSWGNVFSHEDDNRLNVSIDLTKYKSGITINALDTSCDAWIKAKDKLNEQIMLSPEYPKWQVFEDADSVPHLMVVYNNSATDLACPYNPFNIKNDEFEVNEDTDLTIDENDICTSKTVTMELTLDEYPNGVVLDGVYDVADWYNNNITGSSYGINMKTNYYLIIDTGESESNMFRLRVNPMYDMDSDGTLETFTWSPLKDMRSAQSRQMNVLVKGRGSLVIDVPTNVTYQAGYQESFMHMNWYIMNGGDPTADKSMSDNVNCGKSALTKGWIHSIDNCSGTVKCEIESKTETNEDGEEVTTPYCKTHERSVTKADIKHDCGCYGAVERSVIKKWIESNITSGNANYDCFYDGSGDIIYPNVNIFITSEDESSDIRLSTFKDGTVVERNNFWGWIYAPYMTYLAKPQTRLSNSGCRIVGGIIVSDYISNDWYDFIFCRPDEAAADAVEGIESDTVISGFSWKAIGY